MSKEQPVVCLHREQTQVNLTEKELDEAIQAAYWVTCSPCERVWTQHQQALMAQAVLWQHQRLSAIANCASASFDLKHETISDGDKS